MAGGKETPRQKMIGMMYLVLTALLALNVSKSILDAFVAIEENMQKSAITQHDRGNAFVSDLKGELTDTAKVEKVTYYLGMIDKIDKETAGMIKMIDELKVEILKESGEDVKAKNKEHTSVVWVDYNAENPLLPARMNLDAVQAKDQYDVPMHIIIGEDIKAPKGKGLKLWDAYNGYRNNLVGLLGSYTVGEKEFSFKAEDINEYEDNADLTKKVRAMMKDQKYNVQEDTEVLEQLYMELTKQKYSEVHDVKGVHWIGKTFDHSPLVAALASLTSMEAEILSARATAVGHLKGKVSTGEYSFNKVVPLAYGPFVANQGDDFEIQVMMAAFDTDKQPRVTVEGYEGAEIKISDGSGKIKLKAGGSTMVLKGTVAVQKKSGSWKTEDWTHTVTIMEPTGAIELTDLNVLYRGYPNNVEITASGYPTSSLTGSNASVSKSGKGYVVKPGKGKSASLSVFGVDKDGNKVKLKTTQYRVSNLPDPTLYWGAAKSGTKGSKSSRLLQAKYSPEIPLKASFTIIKWTCYAPGLKGAPPSGPGGNLGSAGPLINAVKPGTGLSFNATVRGPDGIARQIGGSWSL